MGTDSFGGSWIDIVVVSSNLFSLIWESSRNEFNF
jgi:hypothetical protein